MLRLRDHAPRGATDAPGGFGIFGVELFIKGDEAWFSEVSPRPHHTGLVTLVSQHLSEFALHARALTWACRWTRACARRARTRVIYGGMEGKSIAFEGVDEALKVPGAEIRLFGKPEAFKKRRMGVALARASDKDTARMQAKLAASLVKSVVGRS